jgi:serine/threonine protein kinase
LNTVFGNIISRNSSYQKISVVIQYSQLLKDYDIISFIDRIDDISELYSAKYKPTGETITIKITNLDLSPDFGLVLELVDIVRNAGTCSHPNILKYNTSFLDNDNMRLISVVEPIRLGSMKKILNEHFPSGIHNEVLIASILREILHGIDYLHENNFIHNNIRAENVFVDSSGQVKISGLHQLIQNKTAFNFVGDHEWMAPEVLSQATTINNRVDIYSLGIMALELAYGKTPFEGWPPLKILLCKLQYDIPPVQVERPPISVAFHDFLWLCLNKNPMERY